MTTDNNDDLLGEAKKLAAIIAETEIGQSILDKVKVSATELLHDIEAKADAVGLGSALDMAVNKAEKAVDVDLNQDGMKGDSVVESAEVNNDQVMTQAEIDAQANAARMAMESAVVKTDPVVVTDSAVSTA